MAEKRLYRSRDNRMIAGVAGGIAQYFDIDPVIVRLIFVVLTLGQGAGLLAYVIGWIIIPEEPENVSDEKAKTSESPKKAPSVAADSPKSGSAPQEDSTQGSDQGRLVLGAILVLLGLIFLFQNMFGHFFWQNFWPLVLIIIGVAIVLRSVRSKG